MSNGDDDKFEFKQVPADDSISGDFAVVLLLFILLGACMIGVLGAGLGVSP